MTMNPTDFPADLSRRGLLRVAVVGSGALFAATLSLPAEAAGKVSQKAVAYRGAPNGKARCVNCIYWQAPAACKLVAGVISPNGWCNIYAPAA